MSFYHELSHYYDIVFPFNSTTYNFLKAKVSSKGRILDIGTGTGNYALAFAEDGHKVTAIDLDEKMIAQLTEKSSLYQNLLTPKVLDMLELSQLEMDSFDLIFCIGNSLVHLNTPEEIQKVCNDTYNRLEKGGTFVLQIVNYDRILDQDIKELPLIHRPEAGVTFIRKYQLSDNLIQFKTRLIINNEQTYDNTVLLYPIRKNELISLLKNAGFKNIICYGGFDASPFEVGSFPLIIEAKK